MTPGFQNKTLDVRTGDGLDDVLLQPLDFIRKDGTRLRCPNGGTTDGLSVPKGIRILPGYDATGDDWFSGVLHDSGYRRQLMMFRDGFWIKAVPDVYGREDIDGLILEAMELQGVGFIRRHTIYRALRMFGQAAFDADACKVTQATNKPDDEPDYLTAD